MANPDADSTHGARTDDGTAVIASLKIGGRRARGRGTGLGGTRGMLMGSATVNVRFLLLPLPCLTFILTNRWDDAMRLVSKKKSNNDSAIGAVKGMLTS